MYRLYTIYVKVAIPDSFHQNNISAAKKYIEFF